MRYDDAAIPLRALPCRPGHLASPPPQHPAGDAQVERVLGTASWRDPRSAQERGRAHHDHRRGAAQHLRGLAFRFEPSDHGSSTGCPTEMFAASSSSAPGVRRTPSGFRASRNTR